MVNPTQQRYHGLLGAPSFLDGIAAEIYNRLLPCYAFGLQL